MNITWLVRIMLWSHRVRRIIRASDVNVSDVGQLHVIANLNSTLLLHTQKIIIGTLYALQKHTTKCMGGMLTNVRVDQDRLHWRLTDRQTILFNIWKNQISGEENDRKVFESSSPSKHSRTAQKKHKSNSSGDDQQSTNFI